MVTGGALSAQTLLITIVPTLWAGMLRGRPANICVDGCRILQWCYALLGIRSEIRAVHLAVTDEGGRTLVHGSLEPSWEGNVLDGHCILFLPDEQRVVDVVGLYHNPPDRAVVLCVDEKSGIQALDRSQPVLPMMPGMPERRTHDYARNGVTSLFAAFNIADGTVISELHRRHRAVEFLRFLKKIDKAVPAGLDVHLVCDNLATHKTPEVQQWLARRPRFHVHFTPTGSSWTSQVERWFGYLTGKKIRRGVHKSVQALEADIRDWIEHWNENPHPFAWTKTAEEILNSLAEYITRISGGAY